MTSVIGIIRRDLSVIFSGRGMKILLLFYIPFLLFAIDSFDSAHMYMLILFFYTYIFVITPFSYDLTYKTIYMMNSLPITKLEIVLSRYLSVFIYFALAVVYSIVYLGAINMLGISDIEYFNLDMIKKVIPVILIYTSVIFPIYFKFPYNIARIVQIILFMLFFIFYTNPDTISRFSFLIKIDMYIISLILYIISFLLSVKLYQNMEW